MRLLLSSTLLGLAWFSAINIGMSIMAWVVASAIDRRGKPGSPAALLTIRLLPALVSSLFVIGIFLPAHWRFEQPETEESFGVVLAGLAALGLGLALRSITRAATVLVSGYRLRTLLRRSASSLSDDTFVIGGVPGISLAGIVRPRILIGSEVLATLTSDELDVAISHEVAHRSSRDNLKRFLMFCAPDVFGWSAAARRLEDRWQAEAECQADAHAVMGDDARAVALASALIKVAQLTVRRKSMLLPSLAWSAFHVPGLLETRIRRLVAGRITAPVARGELWFASATMAFGVPAGVWMLGLSYTLHQVTEAMVTHLP